MNLSTLARAAFDARMDAEAVRSSPSGRDGAGRRELESAVDTADDAAWQALVSACPGGTEEAQVRATHYARLCGWPHLFGAAWSPED